MDVAVDAAGDQQQAGGVGDLVVPFQMFGDGDNPAVLDPHIRLEGIGCGNDCAVRDDGIVDAHWRRSFLIPDWRLEKGLWVRAYSA